MLSNRGTTVPDRLIRDEYETWSTLIAREFELIPSIAPPQDLISIGCLDSFPSSRLRLHPRIPPTPSSLRSLQFSNDISLSIPLSRNLYPRPRRVNRTVSSYSVSSSGRRQPGRRVELVCLAVIPTVGGMHRVCRIIASPAVLNPPWFPSHLFHVVPTLLFEERRNFRYIGDVEIR